MASGSSAPGKRQAMPTMAIGSRLLCSFACRSRIAVNARRNTASPPTGLVSGTDKLCLQFVCELARILDRLCLRQPGFLQQEVRQAGEVGIVEGQRLRQWQAEHVLQLIAQPDGEQGIEADIQEAPLPIERVRAVVPEQRGEHVGELEFQLV